MRKREHYWSLFHQVEKRQLDDLRTDQVEAIFEALPLPDHKDWLVWREGFRSWKQLSHFPDLLMSLRQASALPEVSVPTGKNLRQDTGEKPTTEAKKEQSQNKKPLAEELASAATQTSIHFSKPSRPSAPRLGSGAASETVMKFDMDFDEEESASGLAIMSEDGNDPRQNRYPKRYELILLAGAQRYQNQTLDISMRGMRVRDPLPNGIPNFFTVEIHTQEKVLPVICSVVRNRDGSPPTRLRIESIDHPDQLLSQLLQN